MLKEKITYTDFNGVERTEEFLFNLTKTELLDLTMELPEGLAENVAIDEGKTELESASVIMKALGNKGVTQFFKDLILKSYGEKSLDGKRFIKKDETGHSLADDFEQTSAFDELYFEMITNPDKAAEFVNNLIPASLLNNAKTASNMPNVISKM